MTETPVSVEALEAAAKMVGEAWSNYDLNLLLNDADRGELHTWKYPDQPKTLLALARMIQKHEPELIAESFERRTAREWDACTSLSQYRQFIKQWQGEAQCSK